MYELIGILLGNRNREFSTGYRIPRSTIVYGMESQTPRPVESITVWYIPSWQLVSQPSNISSFH